MSKKPPKVEVPESLREIYAQLDGKPAPVAAATPAPAVDGSLKDIYASLGMAGKFEEPAAAAPPAPPPLPVVFESLKGIYSELGIDGKSVEKPAEPPAPAAPAPRKEEIEDEQLRRMLGEATKNSFDVVGSGSHPDIVDANPRRVHLVSGPGSVQFEDERPNRGSFRDDWDVEVEQNEKATVGPRGEQLDDFDALFQLRQTQQAAQQATAPPVNTNPPSIASGNGVLGNQIQVNSDPSQGTLTLTGAASGVPVEVARWQGDDTETTSVSVLFSAIQPTLPPTSKFSTNGLPHAGDPVFRPYAIVLFGTRGYSVVVEVDIAVGGQINIPASFASVRVAMENNQAGTAVIQQMQLTGLISFGSPNKFAPLLRTGYADQIGPGGTAQIAVPPFAKTVQMFRNSVTVPVRLMLVGALAQGSILSTDFAAGAVMAQPQILPGDCTQAVILNTDGAATLGTCRIVFELCV